MSWELLFEADGGFGQGDPGFRPVETALLYAADNVYLMDNHRLALWCWLQHLDRERRYHLVHLDQHMDFDPVYPGRIPGGFWSVAEQTIAEFLATEAAGEPGRLAVDWANYIRVLTADAPGRLSTIDFITHEPRDVDDYERPPKARYPVDEGLVVLDGLVADAKAGDQEHPLLLNIDVDVVFCEDEERGGTRRYCDDSFLRQVGERVKRLRALEVVELVTIALSPGCCLSWEAAGAAASELLGGMGMVLPPAISAALDS